MHRIIPLEKFNIFFTELYFNIFSQLLKQKSAKVIFKVVRNGRGTIAIIDDYNGSNLNIDL